MQMHTTLTDVIRATSSYEEFSAAAQTIHAPSCVACNGAFHDREAVLHAGCWLRLKEGRGVPRRKQTRSGGRPSATNAA